MIGAPSAAEPLVTPSPTKSAERPIAAWEEVYNSGDPSDLRAFAEERFTEAALAELGGPSGLVKLWQLDRRRYGRVRYVLSEGAGGNEIHWFQTDPARVWLGVRFWHDASDPSKLTGFAVRRGSAPQIPPPPAPVADLGEHISDYLDALEAQDMFSGAVVVAKNSEILHAGGYGTARANEPANTPDTRFNIASLGKMFTAVAALQLVQQDRLALDDALSKHVPEYPAQIGNTVTVRDLLLHVSGIELDEIPEFNQRMLEVTSTEEILQAQLDFINQIEVPPPPRKFDYTNEGINLLGLIIERISGHEYCAYLDDQIFRVAGMTNSSCSADGAPVAKGYMYREEQPTAPRIANDVHLPPQAYPAGAHYSSAQDLYLFHRALVEGRLLNSDLVAAAMSAQIVEAEAPGILYAYGYGFEIQERGDLKMVGHSGGMEGVSARYEYFPMLDILVIALSNYDTSAVIFASHMRDLLSERAPSKSLGAPQ